MRLATIAALVLSITAAHAADDIREATVIKISLKLLAPSGRATVGKHILIDDVPCVDSSTFTCRADVGGRFVIIRAPHMGEKTSPKTSSYLLDECKGDGNLTREACRFQVVVEVSGAFMEMVRTPDGEKPLTEIRATFIDFFRKGEKTPERYFHFK